MSSAEKDEAANNTSTEEVVPSASTTASADSTSGMSIELLQKYLAEKLGFLDSDDDDKAEDKDKILDDLSLDGVVNYIKKNNCKNIITLAGAGISTAAGIPDFRSPGTGLYHNLQKYKLPHPQAIFDIGYFKIHPEPFFTLAKELYPGSFKPTISHYFIKLLIDKGILLRHYTQNIDTLERVAGVPDDKLVEAHGTFHTGHCLKCNKEYSQEWMKERIFDDEVPKCEEECSGTVKPDIVFFGEQLPNKFYKLLSKDFKKCDMLIILGSSLEVQPFASLVDKVNKKVPRLLINRVKVGQKSGLMAVMNLGGGLDFDSKSNSRDVAWLGDCDEGCQLLAEKLGWGDELKELHKKEHERIDKENEASEEKPKEKL